MEGLARIPQDRIAVLIGRKGATRRALEEATNSTLHIDSTSGDVSVVWNDEFDPIVRMKFPDVIRAIGRGMNPERALQLLNDDHHLMLYDMREYVGKNANQQRRIRSRLIGRNGRIRELIEEHSGAEIVIYGSTVVIIGDEEGLPLAGQAIERLLQGAEHSSVLKHLETERKSAWQLGILNPLTCVMKVRDLRHSFPVLKRHVENVNVDTRMLKWILRMKVQSRK